MNHRYHIPQPPLSYFVHLFWWFDGPGRPHARERLLPDGSTELVVNLMDDTLRVYGRDHPDQLEALGQSMICGPHSDFFMIETARRTSVMGVHFKAGGAFPFFACPAGEFRNRHFSLEDLWGPSARRLREQLLEAPTPEAKFAVFERFLTARVVRPLERHPAVAFALKEFQAVPRIRTVSEVVDAVGLSSRRFIEVFNAEVGLTPKTYCRVQRFQDVLRRLAEGRTFDWTELALDCGYFDQAHFINDFKAFSGFNPTTYLVRRGPNLNHVPMPD